MNFIIPRYLKTDLQEFVNYWSKFYKYPLEYLYSKRIYKKTFTKADVQELFIWKNGSKLSQKKQNTLTNIIDKLDIINMLKKNFCLEAFLKEFAFIKGTIWKIYLLHTINPKNYAIFDQHVCRAYYFIATNQKMEIPKNNKEILRLYFDEYIPFFNDIIKKDTDSRRLDMALWAFGKFLKSSYGR